MCIRDRDKTRKEVWADSMGFLPKTRGFLKAGARLSSHSEALCEDKLCPLSNSVHTWRLAQNTLPSGTSPLFQLEEDGEDELLIPPRYSQFPCPLLHPTCSILGFSNGGLPRDPSTTGRVICRMHFRRSWRERERERERDRDREGYRSAENRAAATSLNFFAHSLLLPGSSP